MKYSAKKTDVKGKLSNKNYNTDGHDKLIEDTRLQGGRCKKNAVEPKSRQMSKISLIMHLIALSMIAWFLMYTISKQ